MNKKFIGALVAIVILASIGVGSFAYFTSNETIQNNFKVGIVKTNIVEHFTPPKDGASKGSTITKQVWIKNTGTTNVLARVIIAPQWITSNQVPISASNDVTLVFAPNWQKYWVKGQDGYYYYKKVLLPNEETQPLLEKVIINNTLKDASSLNVDVMDEAIIAKESSIQNRWNANNELSSNIVSILNDALKD